MNRKFVGQGKSFWLNERQMIMTKNNVRHLKKQSHFYKELQYITKFILVFT